VRSGWAVLTVGRRFQAGRLDAVSNAMAACDSYSKIEERFAAEWKVTRRQVRRYIGEVEAQWKARAASMAPDDWRGELTEMALDVYREARAAKHARVALQCIDQIAKLHGITAVAASGVVNVYSSSGALTSPQKITERLKELRALQAGDEPEGGGGEGN